MNDAVEKLKEQLALSSEPRERVALLSRIADGAYRSDPHYAMNISREGLELARDIGDRRSEAVMLRTIGVCHVFLSDYKAALQYLWDSHRLFKELGDHTDQATVLLNIGIVNKNMGAYKEALEAYERSYSVHEEHGNEEGMGAVLNNIGNVYDEIGDYVRALDVYYKSLNKRRDLKQMRGMGISLNNIGTVYLKLKDFDNALNYFQQSLEVRAALHDQYGQALTLGNIGLVYQKRGELDTALEYQERALALHEQLDDRSGKAYTLSHIGEIHQARSQPDKALHYLRQSLKLSEEIGDKATSTHILAGIGALQYELQLYDPALQTLARALTIAEELGMRQVEYEVHESLALCHAALNDMRKAFEHHQHFSDIKDRVQSEEIQRKIAEVRLRADIDSANHEKEIYRLQNEQLELKMELKSKELTTMTMYLVQKNEFLDKLKKRMRHLLEGKSEEVKKVLKPLVREVDENIHSEQDWQAFENQFQQVHQDFIKQMSERYPELTPGELRVCALMKVNLNSKEIAKLLCVSIRNVESYRYRVRKKLKLPRDTNLGAFLASL